MNEKVMIVGGGAWQVPLIKRVKELGYYVINTNLYENSPGFEYADKTAVIDVLNKDKNLTVAQECLPNVVLTDQSDIAVPTVAFLNEKLGINGIGCKLADLFTNKYLMRKFCKEHNFAYPEYKLCKCLNDALEFFNNHKKIIIKPIDSQSSRGVFTIQSKQQLIELFDQSIQFSNREKVVIAEEYIEGCEFTVDAITSEYKCTVLAISQKHQYKHNSNITKLLWFSNKSDGYDYDLLRQTNVKLVEAMELPFGLTHAEYKYCNGKFYLIEIAARGGGTKISSDIVPVMSGVDNYKYLIDLALGKKIPQNDLLPKKEFENRQCVLEFFDFPAGKVKDIIGWEDICNNKFVLSCQLEFKKGDVIHAPDDDRSRVGFYIAYAESREEMEQFRDYVHNTLKVILE